MYELENSRIASLPKELQENFKLALASLRREARDDMDFKRSRSALLLEFEDYAKAMGKGVGNE